MNIGIIPCNNGLGHITRSVKLANLLIQKYNVTLYLSQKKIKLQINRKIIIQTINNNFNLSANQNYNVNWYREIDKKKFYNIDLLISDNLPEITLLNKNVFIYANFFWHEIFRKQNNFFKNLKKIIIKQKTKIISHYLVGHIKSFKKHVYRIGFIGKYKKNNNLKKRGILISIGTSNIGYKSITKDLYRTIANKKFRKYKFYVDKKLIVNQKLLPSNIKIADFSKNMYKQIKVALIKPGFGTIHDCLERGIPIISFLAGKNKEFSFNARILKKNNIGEYFFEFKNALNNTILTFNDNKKVNKIENICKNLKWNGEQDIKKYISKVKIIN